MRYRCCLVAGLLVLASGLVAVAWADESAPAAADQSRAAQILEDREAESVKLEQSRRSRGSSEDPREAEIDALMEKLADDPENANLHYQLGNAYDAAGYKHSALRHFNEALRIDAGLSRAWVNRGVVLKEFNRHDEALESFEKALELDPNDALAHVNYGDEQLLKKNYQAAMDSYRHAIQIDERCAPAYYSIAISFAETGMYRDAARAWRKCAELAEADLGVTSDTFKRSVENAKLMEEIVADAQKQIEDRNRAKHELETETKENQAKGG